MNIDLERFRALNVDRARNGFRCYDNQPLTYWTTALAGEVGELCNMVKKMQRVELGGVDGGSSYTAKDITKEKLKEEIGGIAIYLDLMASLLDIDLGEAIRDTFNDKSRKMGFNQSIVEWQGGSPGTISQSNPPDVPAPPPEG
jgi:NTP pyrophosphatase (non-canonical NTP hydrolase)